MRWEKPGVTIRREVHFGDRIVRCFAERPPGAYSLFERALRSRPAALCLVAGQDRLTYEQLGAWVERVASGLAARGVRPGDRIALLLGNCPQFVVGLLAGLRLGAIIVPVDVRLRPDEVRYILSDSGASAVIHEAELAPLVPRVKELPDLRLRISCGVAEGSESIENLGLAGGEPPYSVLDEEETAIILYTSGTTGRPKGALLSHFNLAHSVRHFELSHEVTSGDRSALCVPASHVTGLVGIILSMINVGGAIFMMRSFKARAFLELVEQEKITHTIIVPAMYNLCLLDPEFDRFDLSSWRIGSYGGSPMPETAIEKLNQKLPNLVLMNGYGATETTSPAVIMPQGMGNDRRTALGRALHCVDILVVDPEGREVPAGTVGEIWIGGPMVVRGYWNNPEATKIAFTAGFWHSGDLGKVDGEGFISLIDRVKDMINRGGYKIYSVEVENVLAEHPGIMESAVVAKPCPVLGERVHAFVRCRDVAVAESDLIRFCAERVSDYKVPESFTFVEGPLPRNAAGKVLKKELRESLLKANP